MSANGQPETQTDNTEKHELAGKEAKVYKTFPLDEFTPACIIAYSIADLPPSKFADNNDPVPSVRFLLSNGEVRKWTNWYRISYHAKATLPKLFTGIPNLGSILTQDEVLFNMPLKVLLESKDGQYSNIIRIKPGTDTDMVKSVFYDKEYVPYRFVKAFGNIVNLRLAVMKTVDGIVKLTQDQMIDPPKGDED